MGDMPIDPNPGELVKTIKNLAATAALTLIAGGAQALTCGGPSGTRTVTVDPADACTATGLTNLGDGAILGEVGTGAAMIDRDAANSNGGSLSITGVGASAGTWSLSSTLWSTYSSLYLYFHFGNGNPADPTFNPDWFLVQLTSGATSGTWSVNPTQLTLSNIAVVGIPGGGQVPEPSSTALAGLGLGLLGLGLARRRKTQG